MPNMISSRTNDFFKHCLSLQQRKGVEQEKLTLVSGKTFVLEFAQNLSQRIQAVIWDEQSYESEHMHREFFDDGFREHTTHAQIVIFKHALFKELDMFGTHAPLLVVDYPDVNPFNELQYKALCSAEQVSQKSSNIRTSAKISSNYSDNPPLILLALQNPENFGVAVRTAVGLGIHHIGLLDGSCHPFLPKCIRSSALACFQMHFWSHVTINDMQKAGWPICYLSAEGKDIREVRWPHGNWAMLLGQEGQGIPQEFRQEAMRIPMTSGIESFNATTALSLALWEWRRQFS